VLKWIFFITMTFSVGRFYLLCVKNPFLHKFLAALEIQFHTGLSLSIKYADCQSFKASVFRHFESEVLLANVNSRSRSLYAIIRPSVVCLLSVCLSVCDVGAPYSGGWTFRHFFHHTIAQWLYFSGAKNRWWGTPLSPEICVQSDPPPFKQRNFDQISAHSASSVIASEKSSIITYRKSTTRFPTSHIDEPCTLPLSPPKGGTKTRYRCLCQ